MRIRLSAELIPAERADCARAGLKNGSLQREEKKEGCRVVESGETEGDLAI